MDRKELAVKILQNYQSDFPIDARPFQLIAEKLNVSESEVRLALQQLLSEGVVSRVGPVFGTHKVGKSFLAAVECPVERLEEVAALINTFEEVNHNYQRENKLNLWFVMTGPDDDHLNKTVQKMEQAIGLKVHRFPMVRSFKIDLTRKGDLIW